MRRLLLSRSVARLSRCSSTLQPNSPVSRCLCSASQPLSGEMLHSRRHLHHLSRFAYGCKVMPSIIGVKNEKNKSKFDWHCHFSYANDSFCTSNYTLAKQFSIIKGVSDNCPTVDVHPATILEGSSHRDGSIYKFCPGFIQIYRYIAVRDHLDSMLNYVVNRSRDDPIIVKQFDMRIKKGDREEDDLELIDGALEYSQITTPAMRPMTSRVSGNCGAVDITLAYLYQAVEATIEVSISKVPRGFQFISECVRQEIQLFDGMVGEPCGLRRYVVVVASDTWMHLKFKVCEKGSKNDVGHYCSFKANRHGFASQQIVVEPGAITVKTVGDIL
uniref:DUF6598 domain-containing protein n=1 Tax=Oryza nivara TaxID=4536 RepID=A0A0E0IH39_ORYNI